MQILREGLAPTPWDSWLPETNSMNKAAFRAMPAAERDPEHLTPAQPLCHTGCNYRRGNIHAQFFRVQGKIALREGVCERREMMDT